MSDRPNEKFEHMLNELIESVYQAGAKERALPPYVEAEKRAVLDYVWRLKKIEIIVREAFPEWQVARDIEDWQDARETANNVMMAVKNHNLLGADDE